MALQRPPQRRRPHSATDGEEAAEERQQAGQSAWRESAAETPAETEAEPEPAQDGRHPDESAGGRIRTAREAARAALRQILELTDKQLESITGVQRTRDGWSVCFEVAEDRRIPSSADILATYESTVDREGELMSFRRVRRYSRGRGDGS